MKLKEFIDSEDYKCFENLINGNIMNNRDILKVLFDTSPYCKDIALLKDIIDVIDKRFICNYELKPGTLFVLMKAVSPYTLVESDIDEKFTSWERSSLRTFWIKYIENLIINTHKANEKRIKHL